MVKILNTEIYNDVLVCKGKLILIEYNALCSKPHVRIGNNFLVPIIISETEEILVNDYRLDYYSDGRPADIRKVIKIDGNKIYDGLDGDNPDNATAYNTKDSVHKVLALPEQFSNKTLQEIKDWNYKNGDELYIKCKKLIEETENGLYKTNLPLITIVELIDNHITLFLMEKESEEMDKMKHLLSLYSEKELKQISEFWHNYSLKNPEAYKALEQDVDYSDEMHEEQWNLILKNIQKNSQYDLKIDMELLRVLKANYYPPIQKTT